jgi:uncharacterized membrane protein
MWARWGYALPLLALAAVTIEVPELERGFWTVLLLSTPLEVAAGLLYLEALRVSPLSLTVPFLSWTPVFTALTSLVLLGEVPGRAGTAGILLVASGSFLLTWDRERGPGGGLGALRREKGILLMALVALIFSFTSTLGKLGVTLSSPTFFGFAYTLTVALAFTLGLAVTRGRAALRALRPRPGLLLVGAAAALMILFHFAAIERTQVAYMISVKRSSLLFSVVLGRLIFKEKKTGQRFLGAAVMSAGMLLLLLQE